MIKEPLEAFPIKFIENSLDFICSNLCLLNLEDFLLNLQEKSSIEEIPNSSNFSSVISDSHPFIEMAMSLKGENYLKVKDQFIELKPFQFYIINRKTPHQFFW